MVCSKCIKVLGGVIVQLCPSCEEQESIRNNYKHVIRINKW